MIETALGFETGDELHSRVRKATRKIERGQT